MSVIGLSLVLLFSGCTKGTAPYSSDRTVIVTSSEDSHLDAVDTRNGSKLASLRTPSPSESAVSDESHHTLYAGSGGGYLVAVDTRRLRLKWKERLSTTLDPRAERWNGVVIGAVGSIAVAPDGKRLFISRAFRNSKEGVAVLDAQNRDLVAFIEDLFVDGRGLAVLPRSEFASRGVLLAAGRRSASMQPRQDWLFVVDLLSFAVTDSFDLAQPSPAGERFIVSPTRGTNATTAYVAVFNGDTRLFAVDVSTGGVIGGAPQPSRWFTYDESRGRVLVLDDGGSGRSAGLVVLKEDLTFQRRIDSPRVCGATSRFRDVVSTEDGRAVAISGSATRTPGGQSVPGCLIAFDVDQGSAEWSRPLAISAPSQLLRP